ncbi:MAG: amidophosphoribosyltransferase [Clostridia bacterium]|nr:amidophosphoribosyltransferase [Clostridia bacterium]
MEKLKEACAVFGLFNNDDFDAGQIAYQSLFAMQHRGQDGAGIAGAVQNEVVIHKDLGLVSEVFSDDSLRPFSNSRVLIGHARYATGGTSRSVIDTQPLVLHGLGGFMAMAHNGTIVNNQQLRMSLQKEGVLFHTNTDNETMMHLINHHSGSIEEKVAAMVKQVRGSYALALIIPGCLIGVRDPWGIRPLCLGKVGDSFMLASESCAFNAVGGQFIRDIEPGEIVVINGQGVHSYQTPPQGKGHFCVFEYVYFARNDSVLDSVSVYESRVRMGRLLSQVAPVDADIVAGVPESAVPAAYGYARESGIPYEQALMKNTYSGRTFITGGQKNREVSVRMKLTPIRKNVEGKRIVLVDDSIVRGTNSMYIVQMLRRAGAKEVHMRIASPPVQFPCHFGINTPSAQRLVGAHMGVDELCRMIGADSLAYLGLDDLINAVGNDKRGMCCACFNGKYPMEIPE